jgi:leucyl-tRNA---protein transferase
MSERFDERLRLQIDCYDNGPCPYLEGRGPWLTGDFSAREIDPLLYELLMAEGFRRSGFRFYENRCPTCAQCLPLRVSTEAFAPSKSQRRVWRRNADLELRVSGREFQEERFRLYRNYVSARHDESASPNIDDERRSYRGFLIDAPLPGIITDYYLEVDGKRRMVANGYIDLLPTGLSSVYFAFDPDFSARSLGVYSVLSEIELAKTRGLPWYYLGFWVPASRKMSYKGNFKPYQLALNGEWVSGEGTENGI